MCQRNLHLRVLNDEKKICTSIIFVGKFKYPLILKQKLYIQLIKFRTKNISKSVHNFLFSNICPKEIKIMTVLC